MMDVKNQEGARRVGPAADLDSEGDGNMEDHGLQIPVDGGSRPANPNPIYQNGKKPRSGVAGSPSLSPLAADVVAAIAVYVGAVEVGVLVDESVVGSQTLVVLRIRGFREPGDGAAEYGGPIRFSIPGE